MLACGVRLSVMFVSSVKTNKHIFNIFSPSGSQAILVFPYHTGWRRSDGNPHNGASNARGYEKITIHEQFSCVYALHCEIKSGVNTSKNVNDYNNVRTEIRFFVLELFNCLRSEVRKCKETNVWMFGL